MIKFGGILNNEKFGGWEYIGSTKFPQDLATGFYAATDKLVGASYEPLFVVAKQLVNGINYLLIVRRTLITAKPEKSICMMVINIAPGVVTTGENASIVNIYDKDNIDESIIDGFEKVMGPLVGVSYKPILLIGTQVVKGINYFIICEAKTIYPNAEPYAVKVVLNNFNNDWSLVELEKL